MNKSCCECASRGLCVEIRGEVCGTCQTVGPLAIEPRAWGESQEAFRARAFAILDAQEAALVEAAPVEVEPAKARCPHYGQIKEFFAVAREMGFDTSKEAKAAWRAAIGMLLGRPIASRSELSGAEWAFCTNALRMGRLFI